mmetsp:Transcript_16507/g.2287  ORF Transcript_16507/g.2287 Transcript_16507/m.2287 type:complete len:118 (-) Transcript_16507:745-1098(-)
MVSILRATEYIQRHSFILVSNKRRVVVILRGNISIVITTTAVYIDICAIVGIIDYFAGIGAGIIAAVGIICVLLLVPLLHVTTLRGELILEINFTNRHAIFHLFLVELFNFCLYFPV